MVFVTHDEEHEINGFFVTNPYEHTDNYFEIDKKRAIEIEYRFRYSDDGYVMYDAEHKIREISRGRQDEERFALLNYVGLPQIILRATENLEEAKKDLEKAYQARVEMKRIRKKYLNF